MKLCLFAICAMVLASCASVKLPAHKVCMTDNAGQENVPTNQKTGKWENMPADEYTEPMMMGLIPKSTYRDRKACLDSGKVAVVMKLPNNSEYEFCAGKHEAPKGCQ